MATKSKGEARIATTRANGRECLINTETADDFLLALARYQQTDKAEAADLEVASRQALELAYGYDDREPEAEQKPFVFKDGIAVIPVHGTLLNRFNSSWGFVTGYNFIRRQLNLALADDDVEAIVFDVDSPGGEAAGNFELCREIMAARDEKPILAVVDSCSASGGYSITASCTRSYAIPSARIGSIGVYRMHIDISKMLEAEGVKITFAKAGEHKTDGNSFEPLSDSVLKEWEESAGKTWDDFIAVVADGRGISPAQVRDTQARVYRADEALDLGLIDAVKSTSEAVAAFIAELAEDEPYSDEDENMADQNRNKPAAGAPEVTSAPAASQPSQDAIAAAIAAHDARQRERRVAIRALDEAKERPALCQSLIENTDLTVDQCKVILADAAIESTPEPKPGEDDHEEEPNDEDGDEGADESAKGGKSKQKVKGREPGDRINHFETAMRGSDHPNVGGGKEQGRKGGDGNEPTDSELANDILAAHASATGRKIPAPAA